MGAGIIEINLHTMDKDTNSSLSAAYQLFKAGELEKAIDYIVLYLSNNQKDSRGWLLMGLMYHQLGNYPDASRAIDNCLFIDPENIQALEASAALACAQGNFMHAVQNYQKILQGNNLNTDRLFNYAKALRDSGMVDQAIEAYLTLAAMNSDDFEVWYNLGNIYHETGAVEKAIECYDKAVQSSPENKNILKNRAIAIKDNGECEESVEEFKRLITLFPDDPEIHFHLSLALLLAGEYELGWKEYEWRWKREGFPAQKEYQCPRWSGENLNGKTIVLWGEQGFGDAIQFVRFVNYFLSEKSKVIIECREELVRLFQKFRGDVLVCSSGDQLPIADYHFPLMSLPGQLRLGDDFYSSFSPYLIPEKQDIDKWNQKLENSSSKKIGLAWHANKASANARHRSLPVIVLAQLFQIPNCIFYSLQKDNNEEMAESQQAGDKASLQNHTEQFKDFYDTACFMKNMDYVVSVDTSVIHLAGALGIPSFALIPFSADWRWGSSGRKSAWYPSITMLRQPSRGDWKNVIIELEKILMDEIR